MARSSELYIVNYMEGKTINFISYYNFKFNSHQKLGNKKFQVRASYNSISQISIFILLMRIYLMPFSHSNTQE